ncbi:MAG TPA: ABC transporter substrate-binding protein [Candidatus Eisenbacteria bacterium]|jgi:peptide/nickel transport system substrate-binding protein|nr:ABC transporter substrate-binding protein [Candidatus Eisenbacteria bacterium]
MTDDKDVSRAKGPRLSRRTMLRLGLLAVPATQVSLGGVRAAAAAQETKLGAQLIGKLEGAEVVTDPALIPKSFKEAPQLAELVKAGKLPPVQERIGQDPLVVKPLREIGKYGGTWRRAFTGPFDTSNGHRVAQNDKLLYYDYTGTKLVPNIARAWEVSPDGKVTTLLLRRGMRWSDGQPFTADDFVFWYQDVYNNKDLVPTPLSVMTIGGKPIAIEKIDAATIRFVSPEPYYALPTVLASVWGIGHHARWGRSALGGFAPAHYLKQFHPKYVSKEDLAKKVAELNFDGWVTMFKNRNDACRNVDLPVVTPWKTTSPLTTPTWVLERNPYSVWVDTDGNQLPYIDRIRMTLGESLEVINLRAIAGEYDSQARHIDISKLPVLLENQQKGAYRVYLDPSDQGADVGLFCNQTYEKDTEIAKWLSTREFRIALSHGIDRAQINETFLLGLGQTGSAAPGERTLYFPGPEYKTLHTAYDVKKANEMLDKLGLSKKDGEGYRLRADGKGRLRLALTTYLGFLPFTKIAEMMVEQWKKIGIRGEVQEMERGAATTRVQTNEHQIYFETQWGADNIYGHFPFVFPADAGSPMGPLYGLWYSSAGTKGKTPPARMREVMDKYRRSFGVKDQERTRMAKDVWKIALDELWMIPLVSNSPASQGVRVIKTNMGNIPERLWNSAVSDNPHIAHTETWYFKS